jgi:hypothetical protein
MKKKQLLLALIAAGLASAAHALGHQEKCSMKGAMTLVCEHADGTKTVVHKDNLIVDAGFDFICASLGNSGSRPNVVSHIAIGTSTTAPAAGQTALVAELDRNAATYAHTNGTKVFTMQATWAAGDGTGAITEAGVFNAAAAGTMLDRVTFSVVNKGAGDTMTITFTFTLS